MCFTEEHFVPVIFRQNLSMYLSNIYFNVYEKIDCVKSYNVNITYFNVIKYT